MTYFYIICVVILYASVVFSSTENPECTKVLSLCQLTVGDDSSTNIEFSEEKLKGERGFDGLKGEKGDAAYAKGVQGYRGKRGRKGLKGPVGSRGERGEPGAAGKPGYKGDRGPVGPPGRPGINGLRGEEGVMGIPGKSGPPGLPGKNGTCPCDNYMLKLSTKKPTNFNEPLGTLCKDSLINLKESNFSSEKYKYSYIEQKIAGENVQVQVKCEPRPNLTTLTCIPPKKTLDPKHTLRTYSFTNISKGFWLSNNGTTLEELYGLNREQIVWFQNRSNAAVQTIRYHCFNSVPFSIDNVEKSLLLLTWNDNTIGPMPTLTKPFYYSVPPETDGCSKTNDKWSYTDIKIVTNSNERVPVIDFFIRDVGNDITQQFKIEHIKLCFD